jgi:hypothetical protein
VPSALLPPIAYRRIGGSHEIWYNHDTKRYTTVPNHPGDIPEGTLRAILKQAGIDPDHFLDTWPQPSPGTPLCTF